MMPVNVRLGLLRSTWKDRTSHARDLRGATTPVRGIWRGLTTVNERGKEKGWRMGRRVLDCSTVIRALGRAIGQSSFRGVLCPAGAGLPCWPCHTQSPTRNNSWGMWPWCGQKWTSEHSIWCPCQLGSTAHFHVQLLHSFLGRGTKYTC